MATGGGEDPWKPSQNEDSRESPSPETEENVVQETEEVFCSYVYYRYNQEREQDGDKLPRDPEIMALHLNSTSTMSRVGQQLAIIGDDINRRYDLSFTSMLSHLALTPENAYNYFCKIAKSLFDSGINWGRVIALLSFGYRMALHVFQQGMTGFLSRIARFISDFLLRHQIAQWIAQQGGWVAALELDNVYVKYMLALLAVILLGQFIVRRFFSS
nr:PREDICTED: bcl-2 homologous antagonist/killer [Lepisosteus oculatus]XP_015198199.1 PREDICTED: bcl-2 homologous antagonist/killer [Lepisosteus oculatus]XP_015198200.1 PREDICTED: bcl-2 homologous antagonist/killer [Lepisosteus oculatus]XP_015198201.1 PREDICTED: bcl-2 homologous antagonist/killer [Lepisosteus oculatus]